MGNEDNRIIDLKQTQVKEVARVGESVLTNGSRRGRGDVQGHRENFLKVSEEGLQREDEV